MITLSYSTLNALLHEPHTWVCKQMGLKQLWLKKFDDGKVCHKIIQESISGKVPHPLLIDLPNFSIVEKVDFDEDCKIHYKIDGKYDLTGFVDGLNPKTKELLEIKTGKAWSPKDFHDLMQWKLYALATGYKKVWLVNTPSDVNVWMPQTIKVFNTTVVPQNIQDAKDFIQKAIKVIENIKDEMAKADASKKEKGWVGKSRWCYYENCPFCEVENG